MHIILFSIDIVKLPTAICFFSEETLSGALLARLKRGCWKSKHDFLKQILVYHIG